MKIKYQDLEYGFIFVNAEEFDRVAYLDRQTGKIYTPVEGANNPEKLPEDVEGEERYLNIPEKKDLDLGIGLIMKFVSEYLPDSEDKVARMFSSREAHSKYESHLEHIGMLAKWQEFEGRAIEQALRNWCAKNNIEIEG